MSRTTKRQVLPSFQASASSPQYETHTGEQVDWEICEYVGQEGQVYKFPVFVMVLGYSRAVYMEFARRYYIHSFSRCLVHAFKYLCGIPEIVLEFMVPLRGSE
jgi:transposase